MKREKEGQDKWVEKAKQAQTFHDTFLLSLENQFGLGIVNYYETIHLKAVVWD